ncbi:MAG: 3-phosphoshikimate 1-carboxyvinyltransferase [Proteobacteria bacterium]|nr:3-phosphoshikimate 1-carboxyvinyltransferase [Pseudomonadota bacterium]
MSGEHGTQHPVTVEPASDRKSGGTGLHGGTRVVHAVGHLSGALTVPGDKSITHRAVMLNAIATGTATVTGAGLGGDCLSTASAMRMLGARVRRRWSSGELTDDLRRDPVTGVDTRDDAVLLVDGAGLDGLREPADVIDAGNSGTTARLLTGILAGQPFFSVLTGDGSLRGRPMGRVIAPLGVMGAHIRGRAGSTLLPLSISPAPLSGVTINIPVASAQLKSALILAGLYASGETVIISPEESRDHTERMLAAQGADVRTEGLAVRVRRPSGLRALDVDVPGDISSAAFWLVAACIHPDATVTVRNVGVNPTRTGIIDALTLMGATITVTNERTVGGEPVADLTASSCQLRSVDIGGAIIPRLIDEVPILAVAASVATGTTTIRDAAELRVKESDRLQAVATHLATLGVTVVEHPDGLTITGGRIAGGEVASEGDHRIAMALAIGALVATGPVHISGAAAVDISYPAFWPTLSRIAPGCLGDEAADRSDRGPKGGSGK